MSHKQQHYRRLMKEQKAKTVSAKKIDHPLAKYNALGQLTCVVCTAPVKSELLWNTHIQSRKHKDNVAALKNKAAAATGAGVKRKPPEPESDTDPSCKKPRTETIKEVSSLPPDFFDSKEEVNKNEKKEPPASVQGAPADFFDKKSSLVETKKPAAPPTKEDPPAGKSSDLPEGFFDDPKRDAKARKVEYKDPELAEWEKFQKSIQKEDDVSDALILERDMESKEDREETEVQEQVSCFLRAENLRQRQEQRVKTLHTHPQNEQLEQPGSEGSESEEVDLDDLLDWRAKVS